ncbi:MAG: hypothetical protein IJ328_03325 [Muribaculaceae bacterium]|nr:hypothetical protein [Muribaculaceae bacterium]
MIRKIYGKEEHWSREEYGNDVFFAADTGRVCAQGQWFGVRGISTALESVRDPATGQMKSRPIGFVLDCGNDIVHEFRIDGGLVSYDQVLSLLGDYVKRASLEGITDTITRLAGDVEDIQERLTGVEDRFSQLATINGLSLLDGGDIVIAGGDGAVNISPIPDADIDEVLKE